MTEKKSAGVKVIGAGFGRTGTSSFKKALQILGMNSYHMSENFKHKHSKLWSECVDNPDTFDFDRVFVTEKEIYNATCDWPSCSYWHQQLKQYPDAKVVLTTRDPESWYKSVMETIFQFSLYGPVTPIGSRIMVGVVGAPDAGFGEMERKLIGNSGRKYGWKKEDIIKAFNEHNEHVKATCPPDKLLVFEAKDGWEPLCKFLNVTIPAEPYPHVNDTAEMKKMQGIFNTVGYSPLRYLPLDFLPTSVYPIFLLFYQLIFTLSFFY